MNEKNENANCLTEEPLITADQVRRLRPLCFHSTLDVPLQQQPDDAFMMGSQQLDLWQQCVSTWSLKSISESTTFFRNCIVNSGG